MARKIEVKILGDAASLERAFGRAKASSSGFVSSMTGAGSALAGVTKKVAAVGAVLAGGGIALSKFGADFEDTMQRIVGLSGVAQDQVNEFSKEVLNLAPRVGKSPAELAKALYFITSSGIAASRAIDVLTNSAKASVAGLGETETVADAVTSAMNAYGQANLSAGHATDILVAAVREGKGEADAIAGSIGNVAALAAQLGVRFDEVGAALAAQTRLGIDAETASVQLQQVFSNLVKVAPQAEKAFKSVGLSSAGLRKELAEKGLLATLRTIKSAFGDNLPALSRAFPNIRALRGLLALIGKDSAEVKTVFEHLSDTTGSLNTAFGAVSKDTAQHFRELKASAEAAGISIGAAFAPLADIVSNALSKASLTVSNFITNFTAAQTIRGKLNVVWTGIQEAGHSAQSALSRAIGAVDWNQVWASARGIADGLQKRLNAIDWSSVGKAIGDGIAKGVARASGVAKELAQRFEDAFRSIDFNKLGRAAGPGLAAAILSAFATLLDPAFWLKNWDLVLAIAATAFGDGLGKIGVKLLLPFRRLLADVFVKGLVVLERISPRLASLLFAAGVRGAEALVSGLSKAADLVGRVLSRLERRIGKPLTFVVKVLGLQAVINTTVRAFRGLGVAIKHSLDDAFRFLKIKSIKAALDVIEPFTHLPKKLGGGPFQRMKASLQATLDKMQGDGRQGGEKTGAAIAAGLAAGIKHHFGEAEAAGEAAANAAAGAATAARLRGGDRFGGVRGTAGGGASASSDTSGTGGGGGTTRRRGLTADQRNTFFDNEVARILLRGGLGDLQQQLAAIKKASALITQRIAATKDVTRKLNLEDQLLQLRSQGKDLRQQIKQKAQDAISAHEFFQLGLGPTGEDRIPLKETLKKRFATISDAVKGTTLDTPALEAKLKAIGKVLAEKVVPPDVRQKINEWFDGIRQSLDKGTGQLTKRSHFNSNAILRGLGLTPEQIRALRPRIDQISPTGTIPGQRSAAFAGNGADVVVHTNVDLDGRTVARNTTRHQQKISDRRRQSRRG